MFPFQRFSCRLLLSGASGAPAGVSRAGSLRSQEAPDGSDGAPQPLPSVRTRALRHSLVRVGALAGTLLFSSCATQKAGTESVFASLRPSIEVSMLCLDETPEEPLFPEGDMTTRMVMLPLNSAEANLKGEGAIEKSLRATPFAPAETVNQATLRSVRLPCSVQSHEEARALGKRLQADLVVWSGVGADGGPASLRLTLLERIPKLRDDGSSRWAWGEITELDLGVPGMDRQWLADLLVGLHLYRADLPKPAAARIELAIREARESGVTQQLHPLHALLGWTSFLSDAPLAAQAALRLSEEEARANNSPLWEAHATRGQADVAAARGEIMEARRLYNLATERYRVMDFSQGEADCLLGQADLDVQLSDLASARKRYREALEIYARLTARDRQAAALKGLGEVAMWVSDYPSAEKHFSLANEHYKELGLRKGEAVTLGRLGDVRLWQSDLDEAQTFYLQAQALFQQLKDPTSEAGTRMSLGNVGRMRAQYDVARKSYEEALSLFREAGDELGQANALRALADALSVGTSYDDARFSYDQAIALYKAAGNLPGEAASLRGLAYLERSFGVGYARRQYEEALFLSHKSGDKIGAAHSRLGLGQLAIGRMEYHEARANFDRARALYKEAGYVLGEALSLQGLAEASYGLVDAAGARSFYQDALTRYRASNLRQGEMQCHLVFGQAAMRSNDLKSAQEAFDSALKSAKVLKDRQGESDSLFLLARLKVRQNKKREAVALFLQTRDNYKAIGVTRNYAIATADLGTLLLTIGEEGQGKEMLDEAAKSFETLGMTGEAESCKSLMVVPPTLGDNPLTP